MFKKLKGKKVIFVTHAPPPYKILDQIVKKYRKYGVGTYGEKAKDGHIGSMPSKKLMKNSSQSCIFSDTFMNPKE